MCGNIGYLGSLQSKTFLIDSLQKLEYRGYDSSGVAVLCNSRLNILKSINGLDEIEKYCMVIDRIPKIGIGHTRWATHGKVSIANTHPHLDFSKRFCMVHNGVIENTDSLKHYLTLHQIPLYSETDSELLINLISLNFKGDLLEAIRKSLIKIEGSYSIILIDKRDENRLYFAKNTSALIIAKENNTWYLSSDIVPLSHTKEHYALSDYDYGVVDSNMQIKILNLHNNERQQINFSETKLLPEAANKGVYEHYMLKEIDEQYPIIKDTITNYFEKKILNINNEIVARIENCKAIHIVACGTSYYAALIAKSYFEQILGRSCNVEIASEFNYKKNLISDRDICIAISQSGETADTLTAAQKAKRKGACLVSFLNSSYSSIANISDFVVDLDCGIEQSVASTKAFTSQVLNLLLFTITLAKRKSPNKVRLIEQEILKLKSSYYFEFDSKNIANIAKQANEFSFLFFLAKSLNYFVAQEGALKLKEISYKYCEAHAIGEMKHGPLALVDKNLLSVVLVNEDNLTPKIISNIEEIKSREGKVLIISPRNKKLIDLSDFHIEIPKTHDLISPIINVIPLQLLAYCIALERGCNVDRPRNLAKSVTVE
jgi:glucosamine--fructose-6-phosphate aminotransferase (isomerizing)